MTAQATMTTNGIKKALGAMGHKVNVRKGTGSQSGIFIISGENLWDVDAWELFEEMKKLGESLKGFRKNTSANMEVGL